MTDTERRLFRRIGSIQLLRYFLVGVIGTMFDWTLFFLLAILMGLYYQASLVLSFLAGSTMNYILNKFFTFRSRSGKIKKQYSVFFSVALICLFTSTMFMFMFVEILMLDKMISRIITTFVVFLLGYLILKRTAFNKKYFS